MVGYELPSMPPLTASALMPLASQAVEQRPERHAGRTGHRWAVRALVVGGLAGAAWLLSGAAAHAADHSPAEPAIGALVVLSPVRTLDPVVRSLAERAEGRGYPPAGLGRRTTGWPATTKDQAVRSTDDSAAASRGVPAVVPELTAPLRLTGGPVGTSSVASGLDTTRRYADVDRHPAATTARPDSVQPAPGSPEPVPVRVHLGAVSGIPACRPGSPSEGGCSAIVRRGVAGTVACHRLPTATDVDVRRYDAEAPTASPD